MTATELQAEMHALLERQVVALGQVLESLQQEREALGRRDAAGLERASRRKQAVLQVADRLERRRLELAPDLASMEALATTPDIATRWEQLLDLTRSCREQNEVNGRMIRRQQRRVEATLQLMRGRSDAPAVYGPDGERRSGGKPGRPLASA